LANDLRIVEYYFTYGLALARTNQCGKALQVGQDIQANVRFDDSTMELVNGNVNNVIEICQENLDNPAAVTPVASPEDGTAVAETPVSES
jgi:hypothetical protein